MRRSLMALAFFISFLSLNRPAWGQAQITTGSIQGTIVDEKGGAVADTSVQAINLDTNLSTTVMTDPDGRFQFLSLAPGR